MAYATTLIQFPLGLVSMAISTAILPALSRLAGQEEGDSAPFRATLAGGLRLVLVLTVPAAVGLLVLARPLVALLFQHGEFDAADTAQTALALRYYLIGLVFAAVDLPLVFAFYARRDTWRPALVGVLGVGVYLAVALPALHPLGMVGLILANGAQLAGHAAAMAWIFQRRIGTLRGHGIGSTALKSALASAAMGGAVYGVVRAVGHLFPAGGRVPWALAVAGGGGLGLGIYVAVCALLRVRELALLRALIGRTGRNEGEADRHA
jgi:putative peptidoglycan lipid II flippase